MIAFVTLIAALCQQPGVGNGQRMGGSLEKERSLAFAAQSACIKRLYAACVTKHKLTGEALPGTAQCLVEKL